VRCGASAMAPESPNLTPESSEICHVEHHALLDDATKARTWAGDGSATRDKDAACAGHPSFAASFRLQQRRSTSASPQWSNYDMTSASYSMPGGTTTLVQTWVGDASSESDGHNAICRSWPCAKQARRALQPPRCSERQCRVEKSNCSDLYLYEAGGLSRTLQ
jgi:hypothetical protein